jgi:hypothetical protein
MVWQFIDVLKRVVASNKIQDDDFADRLSRRYTVSLLLFFFILVGSTQFVGSPIACWTPAQFSGAMVQYTNNICWIANTYYVPTDENLPNPNKTRQYRINYYQWVPFILAIMATFFYLPLVFWHLMARPSGLDSKTLMRIINLIEIASRDNRKNMINNAVYFIDRKITYKQNLNFTCLGSFRRRLGRFMLPNIRSGYYICSLYLMTKFLYILNVCVQFHLINKFIGPNFQIYNIFQEYNKNQDFWESPRFPRVTMCDFVIRTLGENNHRNTIQCTLPINLFNEKIFIFIWFWLFFVGLASMYSFFIWLFTFHSASRLRFIGRYINVNLKVLNEKKMLNNFLYNYISADIVFLLRLVKKNTNEIVVSELVSALWENFKKFNNKNITDLENSL